MNTTSSKQEHCSETKWFETNKKMHVCSRRRQHAVKHSLEDGEMSAASLAASSALQAASATVASAMATVLACLDTAEALGGMTFATGSQARELIRVLTRAQDHIEAKLGGGGGSDGGGTSGDASDNAGGNTPPPLDHSPPIPAEVPPSPPSASVVTVIPDLLCLPPALVDKMLSMLSAKALACVERTGHRLAGRKTKVIVQHAAMAGWARWRLPDEPALTELLWRVQPRDLRVPWDHPTVQAAVNAAKSGDRISVSPGTHEGSITVEDGKKVSVWGAARDRSGVVLQSSDDDTVVVGGAGSALEMSRVTLRCLAEGRPCAAAGVAECGKLTLTDCDVSSRAAHSGVQAVTCSDGAKGAELVMEDCIVHGCVQAGVLVMGLGARATLTGCQLTRNGVHGLVVQQGAEATAVRCEMLVNHEAGVVAIEQSSRATLEGCQLTSNGSDGLAVQEGAVGTAINCSVSQNQRHGACFYGKQSSGAVEQSDLSGNRKAAIKVSDGAREGDVRRSNNRIS